MKAKDLIVLLEKHPEADIIYWCGEDNHEVNHAELDAVNGDEIVLSKK